MSEKALSRSSIDAEKHGIDASSIDSEPPMPLDPALERVVWRRLDLLIIPTVAMFYLLSFIVRIMLCVQGPADFTHIVARTGRIWAMLAWLGCRRN